MNNRSSNKSRRDMHAGKRVMLFCNCSCDFVIAVDSPFIEFVFITDNAKRVFDMQVKAFKMHTV